VPEIELETERLLIREFSRADEVNIRAYSRQEDHWRNLPIEAMTEEGITNQIAHIRATQFDDPRTAYHLIVVDRKTGEFLGETTLYTEPRHRSGEIGWSVIEHSRGRGFATEMSAAMLRFAFGKLQLHRVQAVCRLENEASRRIMAKLGMREEGILRDHLIVRGEHWSSVQAAILVSDDDAQRYLA